MSEIADFLRARYAEGRAIAEGAMPGKWKVVPEGDAVVTADNEKVVVSARRDDSQGACDINHIYMWSPCSVLVNLDVKLALVDLAERTLASAEGDSEVDHYGALSAAEETLCLLARPFAGHPDHKGEEWAP
ncbi:DUF6221 family protein [Streptomyces sp. NBC_00356]|uniref:DUF6221 family protein n=1 Tax=Streptomyces sp. NBC_00356 TaxID=2975724 RepID=UPI002E2759C0